AGVSAIVTNFPFKLAGQMVEHALNLCPLVIVLARLAFLESECRCAILDRGGLAHVHVFRDRLPMMHRRGWPGPEAPNRPASAWFVWNRDSHGPTTIDRISWRGVPCPGAPACRTAGVPSISHSRSTVFATRRPLGDLLMAGWPRFSSAATNLARTPTSP